jgi:predicted kinase
MLGYPGAGKTTVSRLICDLTDAVHIWSDHERRAMFNQPTHSKAESDKLYAYLNRRTKELLSDGRSVVFDTSFNHLKDREHLRRIADDAQAKTILVWVNTPLDLARARAVHDSHALDNHYPEAMSEAEFERIARHLEPPQADESFYAIDGEKISREAVEKLLTRAGVILS